MIEGADGVGLRIPIEGQAGKVCGWLGMDWSKWDPLVIDISVRADSGHAIIERPVLRCDARDALVSPGCLPGLSIGPAATRGFSALVFQEGDVTLPIIVPSAPLWELICATERLVPFNARAETRALDAAFERMLGKSESQSEGDEWILKS